MQKPNKPKQEPNPQARAPAQPKGVTELTEQDLQQVQGGLGLGPKPDFILPK